ncbi:MAG: GNAT family N-acetyltransferase [Deltaproteobacteria bacterium]|nr:GNAT family N-acetyltransferase [Deltaproteobacteria bacterium]
MTDLLDNMKFRRATLEDIPAIIAVQEMIMKKPVRQAWVETLRDALDNQRGRTVLAEYEGTVVAFLIGIIKTGAFGHDRSGWIEMLAVAPKYMGQGIGAALANELFEILKQDQVDEVYTAVRWDSGDMLSFFKSTGFDRSEFINLRKKLT